MQKDCSIANLHRQTNSKFPAVTQRIGVGVGVADVVVANEHLPLVVGEQGRESSKTDGRDGGS